MNEEHKLSTRNIADYQQIDRRKKIFDTSTIVSTIIGIVALVGSLWAYSLNLSKDIGTSYAEIQTKLSVMSQQVDYLVKSNDQFSDFKDVVKDKLAVHDSDINLLKQEVSNLKDKGKSKYNEIPTE